ncbi:TetR/AcrR family transcriptional regulator [Leeia aquatica]|uniref:TetR/AcrR family transcriptional regulator n=1 Tax=Leeia aquatica TaxID=2725557 RepID=A0A847SDP1_9NEIS|nr:TetR/AcrR family transcriptional regulator [Leeia aquatica]NLR76957.1 TetR/AcrR family transcriptional regulator [Leeia aquatica]
MENPSYSLPVLRPGLSKAKYDQILRGARQVFLESGYGSASMDRIAREAGVSKGTLYNYFANKETLFATMIQGDCYDATNGSHSHDWQLDPQQPLGVLTEFGMHMVEELLNREHITFIRIVLAEAVNFPELGKMVEATGPGMAVSVLSDYLGQVNQLGQYHFPVCPLAAEQFMQLCEAGSYRRTLLAWDAPTREQLTLQVHSAVRLFLQGHRVES